MVTDGERPVHGRLAELVDAKGVESELALNESIQVKRVCHRKAIVVDRKSSVGYRIQPVIP